MHQTLCRHCGTPLDRRDGRAATCAACLLALGLGRADDSPAGPAGPSSEADRPGRIGPYRTLGLLGEGGMGTVYLAEQEEPVRRRVALKVVKRGMDTARILARFESERQALALMDHGGIARVFEAGESADGRSWFSMEHVQGEPVTAFADRARLTTEERLGLFASICDAVQHAHQKGIIHRDLKPSNILVGDRDGRPEPKIIDFGIAKAVGQRLAGETIVTELGVILGTPDYMSPEQADLSPLGVDTRSDIYSLGVILYELISGHLPFDFRASGADEVRRRIREEDPPPPSDRFRREAGSTTKVAHCRRSEPLALLRRLRGDLDWITLRAMEKVPDRRYPSAAALAADVRRHLTHTPVEARPPSAVYRTGRFVRRHRVAVAVATLALTALVAFTVTTRVQSRRIEQEARTSERVSVFLGDIFRQVDPEELGALLVQDLNERIATARRTRGATEEEVAAALASFSDSMGGVNATDAGLRLLDEQILARAGKSIEEVLAEEPLIAARLDDTIGSAYEQLGLLARAEPYSVRAAETRRGVLGAGHPETLGSTNRLASLYYKQGRHAEAERLHLETLRGRKRVLGDDHPDTLSSMNNLASLYYVQRRYDEAEPLFIEAFETRKRLLGDDHPDTLSSMGNMALLYGRQGRLAEAEPLYLDSLEAQKRVLGEDHPDTLTSMSNLAVFYTYQGRYSEAESLHLETLATRKRALGNHHPDTARNLYNLACVKALRGEPATAMGWLRHALDAGYANAERMVQDSDLVSLHGPGFDALVDRARRNAAARAKKAG